MARPKSKAMGKAKAAPLLAAKKKAAALKKMPKVAIAKPTTKTATKKFMQQKVEESITDVAGRSLDERVLRALGSRLAGMDDTQISLLVNKDGVNINQRLRDEIIRLDKAGGYIKTSFWTKVDEEYGLRHDYADDIDDPLEPDEGISDTLVEHLMRARSDNNALRKTEPFERYVEHCEILTPSSVAFALRSIQGSQTLPQAHAMKMQTAMLMYFSRIAWAYGGRAEPGTEQKDKPRAEPGAEPNPNRAPSRERSRVRSRGRLTTNCVPPSNKQNIIS